MSRATRPRRGMGIGVIVSLIGALLVGIFVVRAQDGTTISVGQNQTGDLTTATAGTLDYALTVTDAQSVSVLVLGVSPGFAPAFRVLDSSGTALLDSANAGGTSSIEGQVSLPAAGTYTIEIRSASSTPGQFVLSLQAGVAAAPAQPLTPGTPVNGTVDDQTPQQVYSFSASLTESLLLTVSGSGAADPIVTLRDADTHDALAVSSTRFSSIAYRIPPSALNLLVEVAHGDGAAAAFVVCLANASGSTTCPTTPSFGTVALTTGSDSAVLPPESTPELSDLTPVDEPTSAGTNIEASAACQLAANNQNVNVRVAPGTGAGVVERLSPGVTVPVVGRLANNSWFQISLDGVVGWVSSGVVTLSGVCDGVAVINAGIVNPPPPTNPPPPPTSAPLPTNPPLPPTEKPTKEPTTKPTEPPPTHDPNIPTATRHFEQIPPGQFMTTADAGDLTKP